jgi:isopentenyl diphosphate isomerase/L-lactate dehydrogenase-like FMN-dependent dehydrogenase
MVNKDAEKASALAAAQLNQLYVLSCQSTASIEDVVKATKGQGNKYFELDARLPEPVRLDLIDRVAAHPCFKGIIINAQYLSGRVTENEWKNDFIIPPHLVAGNLIKYKSSYGNSHEIRDSYGLLNNNGGMSLTDIRKIKGHLSNSRSDIKVVIKGIMCVEDAMAALDFGADAIYVSNGSHLKAWSAPSTINVLKSISVAVKSKYPMAQIYIDSGARRGTDVMKFMALGADAVFMNKAVMWGLNQGGVEGCKDIFEVYNDELKLCMALTCCF